ncbi:MAG: organomercurial lyase [Anaerolineae bacterium]|nr:organomercurial lyase [Anaerolineae bacterium]
MDNTTFEKLKELTRRKIGQLPEGAYEFELRLQILALQKLVEGKPVTPEQLSRSWQIPLGQVQTLIEQAASYGTLQLDTEGSLIGTAISLAPADIKLQINGHSMYAWCAYDAIYAPAVIGYSAAVESTDPLTGDAIHIKVTPDGILDTDPKDLAATYVGMDADVAGGPESPRCSSMHFFASRENAEQWSASHPGVSVMSPDQIYQLAREFQIEPALAIGLIKDE